VTGPDTAVTAIALGAVCAGVLEVVALWRDRPRLVRGADGRWRAARRCRNGWGRP
jgi:hypothetical protein